MDNVQETPETEEILISLDNVGLLQDDKDLGKGKLVLTTRYVLHTHMCSFHIPTEIFEPCTDFICIPINASTVTWEGASSSTSWGYRDILMHAISKEGDAPALYAQVKGADEFELLELRFIPEESADSLENLYAAFSKGACLNPDEAMDEEDAGNFYFDDNEVRAGLNDGMDVDDDGEEYGEEDGDEFDAD